MTAVPGRVSHDPDDFRQAALRLPEADEQRHMGRPDFRVRGKVFAMLGWPDVGWGMVKLPPEQQEMRVLTEPQAFEPVPGAWGRRGNTKVKLAAIGEVSLQSALWAAWRHVAPKKLAAQHSSDCAQLQRQPEHDFTAAGLSFTGGRSKLLGISR
jgi:hypothetical protein